MANLSRRGWIKTGIAAAAGAAGLVAADRAGRAYGLIPPDGGGIFGPGETLSYASHRLFAGNAMAREFHRAQISKPFPNDVDPLGNDFKKLEAEGFRDWRLTVGGMVARPASYSVADIKRFPQRSQITQLACEEGWSYIAEWIGAPLSHMLEQAGVQPGARFVFYHSFQKDWWESIDIAEAIHPQTLVAYGMNGAELPRPFGGPLRMRVPRQLGYKSLKYITRITVTDDPKHFGKGMGSAEPEAGYAWYAGI
jgi:DMSO/TMAO reductase YedYZ molybdopterin-dependent catalytic subunit